LIEAAIEALEMGGPTSVQARKLAAKIGMSTMAVYTHFGGMPGLWEEVIREGFVRFAAHVAAVPESLDPMADFFAKGIAYREWATRNPQLYRLMFGLTDAAITKRLEQDMTMAGTISTTREGQDAFAVMVRALERVVLSGRINPVDSVIAAGQFLSATHGYVLLEIAGYFGADGMGMPWVLGPLGISVMVGLGASQEDAERAGITALESLGIG
jgi:AcrR family transcriptional regulator